MRKYIILFFSVLPFLFACNHSNSPDDIIPKDQMVSLLIALHTTDGGLLNMSQAPDTLYKYATARYLHIFELHHTDSAQFRKSYNYYSMRTDEMVTMYDTVLNRLQFKADSLTKLLTKQNAAIAAQENKKNKDAANPKPVSSFHPGAAYGVGVAPVAGTLAPHGVTNTPPASAMPNIKRGMAFGRVQKMIARRDSMIKAHLKNKNAVPRQ